MTCIHQPIDMNLLRLLVLLVSLPLLLGGCGEKSTVKPVIEGESVGESQTPGTFMYEKMNELFQGYKLNLTDGAQS